MDLNLKITADGSEARRELASVEKSVQKVESSSKTTGGTVSKVMQSLTTDTSKVNGATALLSDTTRRAGETAQEYGKRLAKASSDAAYMTVVQRELAAGMTTTTSATSAAAMVLNPYALAIGAVAAGTLGLIAVVSQSARHYFEHSKATEASREALVRLGQGWHEFQMIVGGAALGGNFSLVKPVDLLNAGLAITGEMLANRIRQAREFASWLAIIQAGSTGNTDGLDVLSIFGSGPRARRGQGGTPGMIDPWASAGDKMGRSSQRDKLTEERTLNELAEERFQSAKKAQKDFAGLAAEMVGRVNAEATARQKIQLWIGRNTQALKDEVKEKRTEASVYPAMFPHYTTTAARVEDTRTALERMNDELKESAKIVGGEFAAAQEHASKMIALASAELERQEKAMQSGLDFGKRLSQSIMGALQGGGDIGKSIGSFLGNEGGSWLGEKLAKAIGGKLGGALGGMLGPLGAIGGQLLGGLFDKVFGPTDYEKRVREAATQMKALTTEAIKAAGSMDRLALNAQLVGINIQGAFDSKDPEFLRQILDDVSTKTTKLNAAMEEYGFTWEDLGEKQRAAQLGDQFLSLLEKTELLKTAGIDYSTILERQSGDYSKLVQDAIRTGTEIPIALQPILDRLRESGQLIGANGEKLEDLSDISWAKSLTQGFDQVTAAIYDLRDALVHGVGGAIDDLNNRQVHIRTSIDATDLEARGDIPSFANGSNGYQNFGRGTLAMLHGWEKVTPRGKDDSGTTIVVQSPVYLDGREISRNSQKHLTHDLRSRKKMAAV